MKNMSIYKYIEKCYTSTIKKERDKMEIKVSQDVKNVPVEVLVINKFEGEKTSQELANKYVVEKDKFEGKFGQTYLMHTLGQIPADKILVVGFGKKEEFDHNKMREAVAKAVKKLQQIKAKRLFLILMSMRITENQPQLVQ